MCVLSCVQLFAILWTVATRLLCPWDSPGETWARRPRSRCQQVRCLVRAHFLAGRWLTLPMCSRGGDSDSSGPPSPYEAPTPFVRAPPLPPNHPQRPYLLIPPCGEFRKDTNMACHFSRQRMSQPSAIAASPTVSPVGTQDGNKECRPTNSRQTAATPAALRRLDEKAQDTGLRGHIKRMTSVSSDSCIFPSKEEC